MILTSTALMCALMATVRSSDPNIAFKLSPDQLSAATNTHHIEEAASLPPTALRDGLAEQNGEDVRWWATLLTRLVMSTTGGGWTPSDLVAVAVSVSVVSYALAMLGVVYKLSVQVERLDVNSSCCRRAPTNEEHIF